MAISVEHAVADAKRRIALAIEDSTPITFPKDVAKRLVRTIEELQRPEVRPTTDLEKLVKRYGVALQAHDQAGLKSTGAVWPELLRVREKVEDAARDMVKG